MEPPMLFVSERTAHFFLGAGQFQFAGVLSDEHHRVAVHEYYDDEYRGGKRCPPGLAKKHNGCMPPGQAKKWQMGRPLPPEV